MPVVALLLLASLSSADTGPRHWTPPAIASDRYESTPTFSPDGREVYFMRAGRDFGGYRLLRSRFSSRGWSVPTEPPFALR